MPQTEAALSTEDAERCKETILVVDDQEIVLDYVASLLTEAGYHVLTALGPALALCVVERYQKPIHLLLTDYRMPGVTGVELARVLTRSRAQLRVLVMSSGDREGLQLNASSSFIQKPFRPDVLLSLVAEVLASEASTPKRAPVGRAESNTANAARKVG